MSRGRGDSIEFGLIENADGGEIGEPDPKAFALGFGSESIVEPSDAGVSLRTGPEVNDSIA